MNKQINNESDFRRLSLDSLPIYLFRMHMCWWNQLNQVFLLSYQEENAKHPKPNEQTNFNSVSDILRRSIEFRQNADLRPHSIDVR